MQQLMVAADEKDGQAQPSRFLSHSQQEDPHAGHALALREQGPPTPRPQPAANALDDLIHIGNRHHHAQRLPVAFSEQDEFGIDEQPVGLRVFQKFRLRDRLRPPVVAPGLREDAGHPLRLRGQVAQVERTHRHARGHPVHNRHHTLELVGPEIAEVEPEDQQVLGLHVMRRLQ